MRTIELRFYEREFGGGSKEVSNPTAAVGADVGSPRLLRHSLVLVASRAYLEWPQDSGPVRRPGGGDDVIGESSEDRGLWRRH